MSGLNILRYGEAILALALCYSSAVSGEQVTDPSEVNAMRAIRSSLVDPNNYLQNWNGGDPCTSSWTGVVCNTSALDGCLHVHKLVLLNLNLSGNLAPEIGLLSHLEILDFMWNNINGSIPPEIGNITSLRLLLLNGNQLSGSLPEELGNLADLDRLQIDENQISGPIPKSFVKLSKTRHLHMNNNSLSGEIPSGFYRLKSTLHLLLDNNNLSGYLPEDISRMPRLQILQLDNNNFSGSSIPESYGNITTLVKLSMRNCSLQGLIPDLSYIPQLIYLDLSQNKLQGLIPSNRLSDNITTIDLSNNILSGPIPSNFSGLPNLQLISLENNLLNGSVPAIWQNMTMKANQSLILNFRNNLLANIPAALVPSLNVSISLYGNPACGNTSEINKLLYCRPQIVNPASKSPSHSTCVPCPTDLPYESNPNTCVCAIPFGIGYRLKSPSFSDFVPYVGSFVGFVSSRLDLMPDQLYIDSFAWEEGPRLRMYMKVFPNESSIFMLEDIQIIEDILDSWGITLPELFGPYELLNFTLGYYAKEFPNTGSRLSNGAVAGIVVGAVAVAAVVSAAITILVMRKLHGSRAVLKPTSSSLKFPLVVDGLKDFRYEEMVLATESFSSSTQVGAGGYGKVYKGTLADGTVVAIKRAEAGSLQGLKEFFTEIKLLSRVHHRNLVSLVGYCNEEDEQMLVYEFMQNGTLQDHLSAKSKLPLDFPMRLRIALGSARGILYLHTEADPPIFHRDIKSSNILLDSKFVAKVADFGISSLAPVPNHEGHVPDHISTVIKGTPGYLDPEYFLTHKLTDKSDVYSLGVVFLELLTGLRPISNGKNIVREVSSAYRSGMAFSIMDSRMGTYSAECAEKFIDLAMRCCGESMEMRPEMSEVVRELEVIWKIMPEGKVMLPESAPATEANVDALYSASSLQRMESAMATSSYNSDPFITTFSSGTITDGDISHAITTFNPR